MNQDPTADAIRAAARRLHEAGMSVVRVRGDGTKRPEGRWENQQTSRTPGRDLARIFPAGGHTADYGVGVVCGAISGNLLMIEFEGAAVREGWVERADLAMQEAELSHEWQRVMIGWAEYSPSGGIHLHLRVADGLCPGNLKLAQRELKPEEFDARQRGLHAADSSRTWPKTMIETRGEGGFRVAAPSGGPVHPSGRSYVPLLGSPETVPMLQEGTVEAILDVLRGLNEYEAPQRQSASSSAAQPVARREDGGVSPFDDFKDRGDWGVLLDGILDYTESRSDGVELWTRVGKDPREGHSATIGHGGDLLHVFSSSVSELPVGRSLNKAQVFTWLRFGSLDGTAYVEAARELARAGYGSPVMPARTGSAAMSPQAPQEPVSDAVAEVLARGTALIGRAPQGYALMALSSACKGLKAVGSWQQAGPLVEAATAAGVARADAVAAARKVLSV